MKRFIAGLLTALLSVAAFGQQLTIGGNIDGSGNITFVGSTMTGRLAGNGALTLNGLTPFQIVSPTNGQCLVYSGVLQAWQNSSSCGGGGGSGTVTSVALTTPSWLTVAGSPVTTSGTLAVTAATGQTANQFLATPNGSTGAVSVRAIVSADLPGTIAANTSGSAGSVAASGITGITSLPNGSTITTTDTLVASRAGVNTQVQLGTLGTKTQASLTSDVTGNLPNTNLASDPGTTVLCNATTGSATPTACVPIAVCNMMGCVIVVDVVSQTNITLSGSQTIDGVAVGGGQSVLVQGQTTQSQNGIYISSNTGWTRAGNFSAGFVFTQNCDVLITARGGTVAKGHPFALNTSGGALTIGTSSLIFNDVSPSASPTAAGLVKLTDVATTAAAIGTPPSGAGGQVGDCVNFSSAAGGVSDFGDTAGNLGTCAVEEPTTGHLLLTTNGGAKPTAVSTPTGVAVANGSTDHKIVLTSLTAVTSVTITFHNAFSTTGGQPICHVVGSAAIAGLTFTPVGTGPWTGVTLGMTAYTGSLDVLCF